MTGALCLSAGRGDLFQLEVGLSPNSFVCCFGVPLARSSYSVRGVGCSRPEPWTRLHCSELHWRDPVALYCWTVWGAREQQSLRTWMVSFFLGSAVNELAHSSGEWCLFSISRLTHCFCYVAMHCRYFAETKTLGEHLNSSADIFQLGACVF